MPASPPPRTAFHVPAGRPHHRLAYLVAACAVAVAIGVGLAIAKPFSGALHHRAPARAGKQSAGPPHSDLPPGLAAAGSTPGARAAARRVAADGLPKRPNIVFVLTDDLSLDLLRYMPAVLQLQRLGMSFSNYFVSDSLCCPSRSSIFTGDFPHNTGVFSNAGPKGGFTEFLRRGDQNHTFASTLHRAGYATAMMGKYLNGYLEQSSAAPATYVPPGWDEWDVAGNGYPEYGYVLNSGGTLGQYGASGAEYLTYVLAAKGLGFINSSVVAGKPFFLELSTFSPHRPYTPAPQDVNSFPGLTAPRPPNFDVLPTDPPRWLAGHPPLGAEQIAAVDQAFRLRAQAVQSIDRLIWAVEGQLHADGVAGNTYIVFSSDNGLHTGEYRLTPGKLTAFDTDIHVPLIVYGPGVPAGRSTADVAENIDLAKTFAAIAGTRMAGDGHDLLQLIRGRHPAGWRNAALVEHHGADLSGGDPDYQQGSGGNPRTYEAMRTASFLYVEYNDGEKEFYNLRTDPFELHNIASTLTPLQAALLHLELHKLERCHGAVACWTATHVSLALAPPSRTAAVR